VITGGGSPNTRTVYILGISTYGGFEPTSATLDYREADHWVCEPTKFGEDMHIYKRVEFEV
jgi:hypothetical protein